MAANRQRPIKGFRPGKEPPQLRKKRAKQEFGDLTGTQERLVELFAERTPEESRSLLNSWIRGLLVAAIGLAALAALLWTWSWIATAVVGFLALVALVLWWRLRSQRDALDTMIDTVSGPRGRGRKRK